MRYYFVKAPHPVLTPAWKQIQKEHKAYVLEAIERCEKLGTQWAARDEERGTLGPFDFREGKPDDKLWKRTRAGYYMPRRGRTASKDMLALCSGLPKVDWKPVFELFKFKAEMGPGVMYWRPAVQKVKGGWLVYTAAPEWKQPDFCEPLTWERFKKLGGKE